MRNGQVSGRDGNEVTIGMSMKRRGRVEDKVAIVTGAGSTPGPGVGTGRATAIALAREGAGVLLTDVHVERADATRRMIEDEGGSAVVYAGDMTQAGDCQDMVEAALDAFGTIDILVNNIGVSRRRLCRILPLLYSARGRTPETDFRQRMAAASGLVGTEGTGWDVAWAAVFLASDEARWITGVTLPVDAGVMSVTPLMMAPYLREVRDGGEEAKRSRG